MSSAGQNNERSATTETIPVVEESLTVSKERVTSGSVRVRMVVHEDRQQIDEPVEVEEVEVRRVPADRIVDAPVPDRTDGDTLIISLHREIVVIERKLQVFEEIHLKTRRREERHQETIITHRTEAVIEDIDPEQ